MAWTHEMVETVVRLWNSGKTASQIAESLRAKRISRSAVIGKITRLRDQGRKLRVDTAAHRSHHASKSASKSHYNRRARANPAPASEPKSAQVRKRLEASPLPPPCETDVSRKTLIELEKHDCRWPVGDPLKAGFGFCAAEAVPGLQYCCDHVRRAFVASPPKSKSPSLQTGAHDSDVKSPDLIEA